MKYLNGITNNPNETYNLQTDEGINISMTLRYLPNNQIWLANFTNPPSNWFLYGIKLTNNFNVLRQYQNVISYGLSCVSDDLIDPFLINDFSSNRCRLYLLNNTDIKNYAIEIKNP